jgi:hypothetical protein
LQRKVYITQVDGNPLFNYQIKQTGTQAENNSKKKIRFVKKMLPKVKMER